MGIGIFTELICAYHGWAYDNGGRLQGVPTLKDAYYNELDTQEWSLMPVAQLDSYRGLLFATVDPHARRFWSIRGGGSVLGHVF